MLSFPIHQPSFAPENVPDLDYIKDQRKQLAVELGVDLSHLDEVFDRGAENFSRICREVEALLKEKDIVNIASLRKFFNQTDFVQKIGCIFTNREGGDSLDMSGNCAELPLFETDIVSGKKGLILVKVAVYAYFVLSDMHRKMELIKLLRSLGNAGLVNQVGCIDKLVKLSHICTRAQVWVDGTRDFAKQVNSELANDELLNTAFAELFNDLDGSIQAQINLGTKLPPQTSPALGENVQVIYCQDGHMDGSAPEIFAKLLCCSKSSNFSQFCGRGKTYENGQKSLFPWVPLLEKNIQYMLNSKSALSQVFCYVFQIQGSIFDKKGQIKKAVAQSPYIPDDIKQYLSCILGPQMPVLEPNPIVFTECVALERERDLINAHITAIMNGVVEVGEQKKEIERWEMTAGKLTERINKLSEEIRRKAMAPMLSAKEWHEAKKIHLEPSKMKCLQDGKKEPVAINFSEVLKPWREGVTVQIQRRTFKEKTFSENIVTAGVPDQDGNIAIPSIGRDNFKGKIIYRVTFVSHGNGEFELDDNGVPVREKSAQIESGYVDTTPEISPSPAGVNVGQKGPDIKYPDLSDTKIVWELALDEPENSIISSVDNEGNITLTLDTSFLQDVHNPLYMSIVINPDDIFDIGSVLGQDIGTCIVKYIHSLRQKLVEQNLRAELEKQEAIERERFDKESREMNDLFGPVFDVFHEHHFESFEKKSDGIDTLLSIQIPEGRISFGLLPDIGNACQIEYKGVVFRYVVGVNNILAPVQVITFEGGELSSGQLDGLQPVMNIFAKTVFFYTHADEKWRKTVLKDQTDHQKLEKSYFDSLSAGERKRIIRMLPHLARKSRGQHFDFPCEDDVGIVHEESQESLRDAKWNQLDNAGRQTFYLFRLSSVTFNGSDSSQKAIERRKKLRSSPLGRSIILDRIGKTLGLGGKRDPIVPTTGKLTSAGHVLKELTVSEKYKTLKPVEQLEHPDFFSDFVDLLERDNISVSFVPAIVRPYNPTLHLPTAD